MNKVSSTDIKDYFFNVISVLSSTVSEELKLTHKEKLFFSECCYFNYMGGNLSDFSGLWDYLKSINFFERKTDCSQYKTRLATKRWIRGGHGKFVIPRSLDIKLGEEDKAHFAIEVSYDG